MRDLGLIVSELVCNAAKHAFSGEHGNRTGTIVAQLPCSEATWGISVADDGHGMPAGVVRKPGHGLGIVERLAAGCGGTMEVALPGGTIVTVRLPAPQAAAG